MLSLSYTANLQSQETPQCRTQGQQMPLFGKHHIKWVRLEEMRSQGTYQVCPKIQVIKQHVYFLFSFYYCLPWYIKLVCFAVLKTTILIHKNLWANKFRKWFSHCHIKGCKKSCSDNSSLAFSEEHPLSKQITILKISLIPITFNKNNALCNNLGLLKALWPDKLYILIF